MIGCNLSSGLSSWAAARLLRNAGERITCAFADTREEDEDNYRFLRDCVANLRCGCAVLRDGRTIWQVFRDVRYIGNSRVAPCSVELKQNLLDEHWKRNPVEALCAGFCKGEEQRRERMQKRIPERLVCPLIDAGMYKDDCFALAEKHGLVPPRLYDLGFDHANCGGFCVRAGLGSFRRLLAVFPKRYAKHEREEQAMRDFLGADVSILRDRRGGMVRTLTLAEFRRRIECQESEDAIGGSGCSCLSEPTVQSPVAGEVMK